MTAPVLTAAPAAGATEDALPPAGLLLLVACAAAATAQGGFHVPGQLLLGGLVLVAVLVGLRGVRPGRGALPAAALAGWSLVAAALGGELPAGVPGAVLVVLLAAAHATVRRLDLLQRAALVDGLVGLGVVVGSLGWVGVALHLPPLGHADSGVWRAATTLTYENAAAGLLVPLALVALARLSTPVRRVAGTLLLVGAGATLSRAGGLALAVGLVVLLALRPEARRPVLGPLLGATVAGAGLMPSVPVGDPARPLPAAVALVLGVALAVRWRPGPVRPVVVLALAAAALCGLALLPAVPDAAVHLVDLRVGAAHSDRLGETRAALEQWAGSPLVGTGPSRDGLQWRTGDTVEIDRYAHDEYLQVLWKTGLVGAALLLWWLLALVRPVLVRPVLARSVPRTALSAGCLAALAALALASGLDLLWHLPLIPLVGVLLTGVASPTPSCTTESETP